MRRATITAVVAVMVTVSASAYLSGLLAFQFLEAAGSEKTAAVESVVQAVGAQALLMMLVMVAGLAATISAARAVLLGRGLRNPVRTLRGPIILAVAGAVVTIWIAVPGPFLVLVAGIVWGTLTVVDETRSGASHELRRTGSTVRGDVSDFV